ncbi:MAG: RNA-binding protein [Ignavibacteriaceae bacterium]|nr:RNA-binding protein [Ignavibacteriaceae bacterium]
MSTKLFVGSLPWSVDDDALKSTFEAHGSVVSAKVVKDRESGRSKGFGFVEMSSDTEAQNAMQALNGSEVNGRNIIVNEAKPKN